MKPVMNSSSRARWANTCFLQGESQPGPLDLFSHVSLYLDVPDDAKSLVLKTRLSLHVLGQASRFLPATGNPDQDALGWSFCFFQPTPSHPLTSARQLTRDGHRAQHPALRSKAWARAALAHTQLGVWPSNTAYIAFIWNTEGFSLGSSVLSFTADEIQQLR